MKFEKIGKSYYVNSQLISRKTFEAIFKEIWNKEDYEMVIGCLTNDGFANIDFSGNQLVDVDKLQNEYKKEHLKAKLLAVKIKAIEDAFLELD